MNKFKIILSNGKEIFINSEYSAVLDVMGSFELSSQYGFYKINDNLCIRVGMISAIERVNGT